MRVPGDGADEAKAEYKANGKDLEAGRTPQQPSDEMTVADACNKFLTDKWQRLQSRNRRITPRTFAEYRETAERIAACLGKDTLASGAA